MGGRISVLHSPHSIKDRNGVDISVGDVVFYLAGSLAGDSQYETCNTVVSVDSRHRLVKMDNGDYRYWHEVWTEPTR